MRNLNKYKGLLIAFIAVAFTFGCDTNDFDTPPVKSLDESALITIAELRALCPNPGNTYPINDDLILLAVITMDETSTNPARNVVVQDETSAALLRLSASTRAFQGDSVRINLKGTTLQYYSTLFQVENLNPKNIVVQKSGIEIEPILVTIAELNASDFSSRFQSKLIKLENVQFRQSDLNKKYANAATQSAGSLYLENIDKATALVRTNGTAKFADVNIAQGSGTFIGIANEFGGSVQLTIRKLSDVQLNNERF